MEAFSNIKLPQLFSEVALRSSPMRKTELTSRRCFGVYSVTISPAECFLGELHLPPLEPAAGSGLLSSSALTTSFAMFWIHWMSAPCHSSGMTKTKAV